MMESADPKPQCLHDDENPFGEVAEAATKRRMFNPFRSLKKLFTSHHGKKSLLDTNTVSQSSSALDQARVKLMPDVTTSSSTDTSLDARVSSSTGEPVSSRKTRRSRSARQVTSLSVDESVITEEQTSTAAAQTDGATSQFTGSGHRPLDLKLGASRASSSDAVASNILSNYPSSLLWKSDSQLTRSFSLLTPTQGESDVFTFRQANAINLEDVEEVFFASSRPSNSVAADESATADIDCVDLNEIGRRSAYVLISQAAIHKRAVRPPGRRSLSVYQPYLVQPYTQAVDQVKPSNEEAEMQETLEKNGISEPGNTCDDADDASGGTQNHDTNQPDDSISGKKTTDVSELSADSVRLQKVAKVHDHHEDVTITKRRRTIAVSTDIAEAVASHVTMIKHGRRFNNARTEMSMKLINKQQTTEPQSELEQAFSRLRRCASQTAQTSVRSEHNRKVYTQESKPARSKPVTSQSVTSPVSSQPDDARFYQLGRDGLSRLGPDWKSMSSLASEVNETQKTSSAKSSQTSQPEDIHLMPNTKVASAPSVSNSHCFSGSAKAKTTTEVKSHAQSGVSHSVAVEKLSTNRPELRSSDKKSTKPTECTSHLMPPVTQSTEISKTSGNVQPGGKLDLGTLVKTSDPSLNSEIISTDVGEQQRDCVGKEKQTSALTASEALALFTSQENISQVSPRSDVESQQTAADRQFLRQKSLSRITECHVNSPAIQLVRRSLDASFDDSLPQGLRSCAEWKMDDSGNRLDKKLRKSHSIALKPCKDPSQSDTNAGARSVLKRTTSAIDSPPYHSPVHRDVVLRTREVKDSAESADKPYSGTLACDKTQPVDNVAGSHVQDWRPLRADGQFGAAKKLASVAVCDGVPGEPIWFALARQKTLRWNEGKV